MLIAASTLAENFEEEKAAFVAESTYYGDPYIINFKAAIDQIMTTLFGIDTKGDLKAASKQVEQLVINSKEDLAMVREQIGRGFRSEPATKASLLDLLGYNRWWSQASRSTQEGVIGLLLAFRNNLTAEDRTAMEAQGVSPARIDNILAGAASLNQANVDQEKLKGTSREKTADVNVQLNEIHQQAMDICRIGQRLFKHDPVKREKFVFSKIVAMQGTTTAAKQNEEAATE